MPNQQHTAQHAAIDKAQTVAPKLSGLRYVPRWIGGVFCYIFFWLGRLVEFINYFTAITILARR